IVAGLKGSDHPDFLRAILENAGEVILINPKLFPQEIGLPEAKGRRIEVIFGEFAQVTAFANWSKIASVRELPGIGDFIPDWPINILAVQQGTNE
ncbi:MAG TPA: hypothetical protein VIT23_03815, partial [Terrimicrobiaceae bacterium]